MIWREQSNVILIFSNLGGVQIQKITSNIFLPILMISEISSQRRRDFLDK